jgi:hypothetical protein
MGGILGIPGEGVFFACGGLGALVMLFNGFAHVFV